jgi:integrase/recombinase XerD
MTPLRQRMIDDMQLRNLAAATQTQYIHHVAGFARYFGTSPADLDIDAVRQYQLHLLNERKLSPEAVNQFVSAIKFLYLTTLEMPWTDAYFPSVRRAHKLPVVLSQEEVLAFFDHIPSLKYRAALVMAPGRAPKSCVPARARCPRSSAPPGRFPDRCPPASPPRSSHRAA